MGDRNTPIKFGPDWLRNLGSDNSAPSTSTAQAGGGAPAASGSFAYAAASSGASHSNTASANTTQKIQLAKLRYGREEMLALYERNVEPPLELKQFDLLYNPREKPPFALNSNFESEQREVTRGMSHSSTSGDRYGMVRTVNDVTGRARGRLPFTRQSTTSRTPFMKTNGPGYPAPGYSERSGDDGTYEGTNLSTNRSSWSGNGSNPNSRNAPDSANDWNQTQNKGFRKKWVGNTNWRRQTHEEAEEWRSQESSRSRPSQSTDKWEREWPDRGDRSTRDKPSWSSSSNRRQWSNDNNEENLPEWAVENMEACGGTFDSSGAFHGYSNDDFSLPKSQGEAAYSLTRSHTQGSFTRSKASEEGSEEWWASEKAKKLSPKRFDANEIKFKKPPTIGLSESKSTYDIPTSTSATFQELQMIPEKEKFPKQSNQSEKKPPEVKTVAFKDSLVESKTFDSLMRSDINVNDANDEGGNFKSVMITPNNALRTKHQNIVSNDIVMPRQSPPSTTFPKARPLSPPSNKTSQQIAQQKMVESMFDLRLQDDHTNRDLMHPNNSSNFSKLVSLTMGMSSANTITASSNASSMAQSLSSPNNVISGLMSSAMAPGNHNPNMGVQLQENQAVGRNTSQHLTLLSSQTLSGNENSLGLRMSNTGLPQGMSSLGLHTSNAANASALSDYATAGPLGVRRVPMSPSSLFMSHGDTGMLPPSEIHRQVGQNPTNQGNLFPLHGLQPPNPPFSSSIYSNILQHSQTQSPPPMSSQNLADQWYYEDPMSNIQGPFSSKDMLNWYRAGFFSPYLMLRRACESHMRPLGSYGPFIPFLVTNLGIQDTSEPLQFGNNSSIGRNTPFTPPTNRDSLWSNQQPNTSDMLWMHPPPSINEPNVNDLPTFFWDQQPNSAGKVPLLPEDMKTEDQILAQLRASQMGKAMPAPPFQLKDHVKMDPVSMVNEMEVHTIGMTPDLGELEKLIKKDSLTSSHPVEPKMETQSMIQSSIIKNKPETKEENVSKPIAPQQKNEKQKIQIKAEDKSVKPKENNATKNKKKSKDEKKDESFDNKFKDDDVKIEKRSQDVSPVKVKKDDKPSKKELEKEKREWIKEGFTIVKGPEKGSSKDNKKKLEEIKSLDEVERKRKEEETLQAEEEKRRKQAEMNIRQQEQQSQQQARHLEAVSKKAPWSAVATQSIQHMTREGPTLAEIQRLEREKKLEQMKEQQAMMHLIAQQQQAALAREQEMQAGLNWAKKKPNQNMGSQSLAEIQAETRKQAMVAAAMAPPAPVVEEPVQTSSAPWGTGGHNGGGFWDVDRAKSLEKAQEPPKPVESVKPKKKTAAASSKKESTTAATTTSASTAATTATATSTNTPAHEFNVWCSSILSSWNGKIDVETFVGFLKDIESPFEVKEYVKCYLGESKDSNDFARLFLEKRSKLLRAITVTPSDDLCSPAAAINPRTASTSDYQEIKSKTKKSKKKMLKVDARILGFSVTAAEDRINVGDIDTA